MPVSPALELASPRTRPLASALDLGRLWETADVLVVEGPASSPYITGFAASARCVEAAQRLRFEVFNLELNEGLASSSLSGLDRDAFDDYMTHLVLLDRQSGRVVGTYRAQTLEQAARSPLGSYSGQEYDLSPLADRFPRATECGRACLDRDHRNPKALLQLWLGLGAFMNLFEQQFLFGCCSIPGTDPQTGWRALATLKRHGHLADEPRLRATPAFTCGEAPDSLESLEDCPIPKLFKVYLRLGARVFSDPAVDRSFGTIDFLVLLDAKNVSMSSLRVVV